VKIEIRQRDKRALIGLGVAALLFLLADQLLLPAYDRLADARETARQREDQLDRYRIAAGRQGIASGVLAQVEAETDRLREQLLPPISNTPGGEAQGARFGTLIESAAEEAGILLRQRDAVETRRLGEGDFEEVSIGLSFDALPEELAAFLGRLRGSETHLAVVRLQVTPIDQALEIPEDRTIARTLQVTMTVAAVRAVEAEASV